MQTGGQRGQLIMELLEGALARSGPERDAWLTSACRGDPELLREVNEAIEWEQRMGRFLQTPVAVIHDSGSSVRPRNDPNELPGILARAESGNLLETGQTVANRFLILGKLGPAGWALCTRRWIRSWTGGLR